MFEFLTFGLNFSLFLRGRANFSLFATAQFHEFLTFGLNFSLF
jgi:hypothetical protein